MAKAASAADLSLLTVSGREIEFFITASLGVLFLKQVKFAPPEDNNA
jgi:hypothetical protein